MDQEGHIIGAVHSNEEDRRVIQGRTAGTLVTLELLVRIELVTAPRPEAV